MQDTASGYGSDPEYEYDENDHPIAPVNTKVKKEHDNNEWGGRVAGILNKKGEKQSVPPGIWPV